MVFYDAHEHEIVDGVDDNAAFTGPVIVPKTISK